MTKPMTDRERFLATLRFEETDRPVRAEAIGVDNDTYALWREEGWEPPDGADNHMVQFQMDNVAPAFFGSHLYPGFYPPFEEKVLEDDGRRQIVQTFSGGTMERFSDGSMSVPRFISFAVTTMDDLNTLMPRLDPNNHSRVDEWSWAFDTARENKLPLIVYIPGCFGFHRHLMGFENLMVAYALEPDLIHAMSRAWEALMIGIIDRCRVHGEIDMLHLWEDMCYKNGSMISPKMFGEYIQPYYQRVCTRALEQGVTGLGVDTDGDCTLLIPLFMEAGINYMEPFEVQAGMDIRKVREMYPNLVVHGGLDKRALAGTKEDIDAEINAKVPFMLEKGGYIPAIDHVVPPDVPIKNWLYFLERVRNRQSL
jgi:uroporphyrinogen decarboxylase